MKPEGCISLPFTLEDYADRRRKTILTDFVIIRAESPYNMLLGRTGLWQLRAVASTVHGLLKFPTNEGVIILQSAPLRPPEQSNNIRYNQDADQPNDSLVVEDSMVNINPRYPDQTVKLGGQLPTHLKNGLEELLRKHKDVFAWVPKDMTGAPKPR